MATRLRPQQDAEIDDGQVSWRSLPGVQNNYIGRCLYSKAAGEVDVNGIGGAGE
jgi:hypothetical protein